MRTAARRPMPAASCLPFALIFDLKPAYILTMPITPATLAIKQSEVDLVYSYHGIKNIELVSIPRSKYVDIDHTITLFDANRILVVQITGVRRYMTFRDAIVCEGLRYIAPDMPQLDSLTEQYTKKYGGHDKVALHGVLALNYKPVQQQ